MESFSTPVDLNTWCNQRHNVPYVFPETQQADNFTPPPALFNTGMNFGTPRSWHGRSDANHREFHCVRFPRTAQYVQQWNGSVQKSFGQNTSLEVGYIGSRGFHLQRAHLINNTLPGPVLLAAASVQDAHICSGNGIDAEQYYGCRAKRNFPVSTINLLENTAQSWYDAGYVNVRRRIRMGLAFWPTTPSPRI